MKAKISYALYDTLEYKYRMLSRKHYSENIVCSLEHITAKISYALYDTLQRKHRMLSMTRCTENIICSLEHVTRPGSISENNNVLSMMNP